MDNVIAIGTTPTISATIMTTEEENLDFDLVLTDTFHFYIKQYGGSTLIEKSGDDITVYPEDSKVMTYLTQNDTLQLKKGKVEVEIRWLFKTVMPNGDYKAGKTTIYLVGVDPVLKKEVITNE